ncbi:hypothetical protein F9L33_03805 [Amylibacter sp. SFDW26]|uniref:hypothetical protein n=1 Tax=Amylibacter sp. SFDW26 TaxID=2652722 RepID=UPI001262048C|nr:hypothetical protein [Amylibacter sp. SFDW26]KAB7615895.1 hypothetical protein F9L33_03805 [Amylibacter sp. SFDW26]
MPLILKHIFKITCFAVFSTIGFSNHSYAEIPLDMKKELTLVYNTCLSSLEQGKSDAPELLKHGYKKKRFITNSLRTAIGRIKNTNLYVKSPNKIRLVSKYPIINISMYSRNDLIGCKIIIPFKDEDNKDNSKSHNAYYSYLINTLKQSKYKYSPAKNRAFYSEIHRETKHKRKETFAFSKGKTVAHIVGDSFYTISKRGPEINYRHEYTYIQIETQK